MKKLFLFALWLVMAASALANETNVVLVTLDGLRWQELFSGIDTDLMQDERFVKHPQELRKKFWHKDPKRRREKLMPFVWGSMARNGVMIGDREQGSYMSVSNPWYFSYPGYNEILTGKVDPAINSNKKVNNPNSTLLEWLQKEKGYANLAAFGSWDVFPFIYNVQRSKLHVNGGFQPAYGYDLPDRIRFLNRIQRETPSPWENVRLDVFTHHFALSWLKQKQPRLLAIHYGETDDFAHDGRYDHYIEAAHRADGFLRDLWQTLQTLPKYRNRTVLLVTTDHGRGKTAEDWQHHASARAVNRYMKDLKQQFPQGIVGSNEVWLLAMGSGIAHKGLVPTDGELHSTRIAPTVLKLMGASDVIEKHKLEQPLQLIPEH